MVAEQLLCDYPQCRRFAEGYTITSSVLPVVRAALCEQHAKPIRAIADQANRAKEVRKRPGRTVVDRDYLSALIVKKNR